MGHARFQIGSAVRRLGGKDVFLVEKWSEAVNKYQLKQGNNVLTDWVAESDLESADSSSPNFGGSTLVPDPLVEPSPKI